MSERPHVTPDVLAQSIALVPSRLAKKLEQEPDMANAWTWEAAGEQWRVTTDKGEVVTLSPVGGVISAAEHAVCGCLLAPKCLHLLAVLHALEVGAAAAPESAAAAPGDAPSAPATAEASEDEDTRSVPLTEAHKRAAAELWRATSELLHHGGVNASLSLQADLLRAVHACRLAGLYSAANAGMRAANSLRSLRRQDASFSMEIFMQDVHEAMRICWAIRKAAEAPTPMLAPRWRGTARRVYEAGGGARLFGLFAEDVVTKSGYGGVVTTVSDRHGNLFTIPDIKPGGLGRVQGAYKLAVRMGDTNISPIELCRAGLFVHDMTASPDGRLGAGQGVKAVRADACTWRHDHLAGLWKRPLGEQLDRVWQATELPAAERPAGTDLLFLRVVVMGATSDALLIAPLDADDKPLTPIRAVPPSSAPGLAHVENLRVLGRAPGLALWVIARVSFTNPRTVFLLTIAPAPEVPGDEAPELKLPDGWMLRCNMGLDKLERTMILRHTAAASFAQDIPDAALPDVLEPLRRRLQRLIYGGRMTSRGAVLDDMRREAQRLRQVMMPQAAAAIDQLASAAVEAERTLTGERLYKDHEALASAWMAGATYMAAARRGIERIGWEG
jgi:hypothetical protein